MYDVYLYGVIVMYHDSYIVEEKKTKKDRFRERDYDTARRFGFTRIESLGGWVGLWVNESMDEHE